jgi:crotonobetainyl-CoA:carnitine CoA-transferase CaiB-like acyl-CoA transferase
VDPQFEARQNIVFVADERAGEYAIPNVVPRLSETPGRIDSLGPALGAHNAEIFQGLLGLSP